jgi:hypothetical protein
VSPEARSHHAPPGDTPWAACDRILYSVGSDLQQTIADRIDFASRLAENAVVADRGRIRQAVTLAELQGSRELQRELLAV